MKTWEAKLYIKTYYNFKEEINIDGVRLYYDDGCGSNFAIINLESKSIDEAERTAIAEVSTIMKVLRYTLDSTFECTIFSVNETTEGQKLKEGFTDLDTTMKVVKDFPVDKVNEIKDLLHKYYVADEIGKKAFNYFVDGFNIKDHGDEAFLNFFKSIEIVSNKYLGQAKIEKANETSEEINKLLSKLQKAIEVMNIKKINGISKQLYSLGFIEAKRKLKIALKNLGLDEYEKQINDLPDLRKNVAHGMIEYEPITFEQMTICKDIAKKVILKYLEKNQIDNKI
ncbi:hypothetical protein GKZ28_18005 [Clostridium chromiireducens]|uniref:Uncharacterized protein n=1 Tax=Clostridium chromiireducens TaxID=225345 RepID=A0A964RQ94_9CLOT|nr:hypothetical protein [Clostridium chromiireducens]MVX65578.1 hypothetical protein [Clostridium chromiireducens]